MVQFCCIIGCGNRSNREKTKRFYRIPNVPKKCDKTSYKADITLRRRKQWLLNTGRADLKDGDAAYSPGYIRICSDHFVSGMPSVWSDLDNIDWAPSVDIPQGYDQLRKNGNRRQRGKSNPGGGSVSNRRRKSNHGGGSVSNRRKSNHGGDSVSNRRKSNHGGDTVSNRIKSNQDGDSVSNIEISNHGGDSVGSRRGHQKSNTELKRILRLEQLQHAKRLLKQLSSEVESPSKELKVPERFTVKPLIHKITVDSIVKCPEETRTDETSRQDADRQLMDSILSICDTT